MRWISIPGQFDINKLTFLWRLITLSTASIYYKMIRRYIHLVYGTFNEAKGPIWNFLETAETYSVLHMVKDAIVSVAGEYMG